MELWPWCHGFDSIMAQSSVFVIAVPLSIGDVILVSLNDRFSSRDVSKWVEFIVDLLKLQFLIFELDRRVLDIFVDSNSELLIDESDALQLMSFELVVLVLWKCSLDKSQSLKIVLTILAAVKFAERSKDLSRDVLLSVVPAKIELLRLLFDILQFVNFACEKFVFLSDELEMFVSVKIALSAEA